MNINENIESINEQELEFVAGGNPFLIGVGIAVAAWLLSGYIEGFSDGLRGKSDPGGPPPEP